ncbi:hypothetical protein C7B76_16120 [filamentous cyanobacterium CCP2]|nr:hypothetical protein C7B76_16120 [filamentous cyanobacterium CCP2]
MKVTALLCLFFHDGYTQQTDAQYATQEEDCGKQRAKNPVASEHPTKDASCGEEGGNHPDGF